MSEGMGAVAFFLYKAVWFMIMPVSLAAFSFLAALAASWKKPRLSRGLMLIGLLVLFGLGSGYVAQHLAGPLERSYPSPSDEAKAEAVVVLGGAVDIVRSTQDRIEFNERCERIIEGAKLVRGKRAKTLIVSGGSGDPQQQETDEATFLEAFAKTMGVRPSSIIVQKKSRTTNEDAKYTAEILRRENIKSFFLVTSATHMRRAVGCFRKQGFEPTPYPVDFMAEPRISRVFSFFPSDEGLRLSTVAIHEYLGYAVYRFLNYL